MYKQETVFKRTMNKLKDQKYLKIRLFSTLC